MAQMGAKFLPVHGVSKLDPHSDYGLSGRGAVATVGHIDSGGPAFNTKLSTPYPFSQRFLITGATFDSAGAALPACTVLLLDRYANPPGQLLGAGVVRQETISNGSGVFTFTVDDNSTERWGIATNTGVAGATIGPLTYTVA